MEIEATNEDKDENLDRLNVINQEIIKTKPKFKFIANRIPKYVATPFPPLNLSQTGKT